MCLSLKNEVAKTFKTIEVFEKNKHSVTNNKPKLNEKNKHYVKTRSC